MNPVPGRATSNGLLGGGALLVALLTLTPAAVEPTPPASCFWCGDLPAVDLFLNILLFLPLGAGLGLRLGKRRWAFLASLLVSVAIEVAQFTAIPGRDASIRDVVANATGGFLGAAVVLSWSTLLWPSPRPARRLLLAWAAVVGTMGTVIPWLLQPVPPVLLQFVQWQPEKGGYDRFGGRLDSLSINGEVLAPGDDIDLAFRPGAGATDTIQIRVVATDTTGPTRRIAIVARVASQVSEDFMLGRSGNSAVFRKYLRASLVRFRTPVVSLPSAFPTPGQVTFVGRAQEGALQLTSSTGAVVRLRLTAGLAWTLVLPRDWPVAPWMAVINTLFVALLAFPAGWWAARGGNRAITGLVTLGIVVIWVAAPFALHMPPPTAADTLGGVIGLVGAWWLNRRHAPVISPQTASAAA